MAIQNVAPTKSNLLAVKEQLAVSTNGYELLEEKREILVRELMHLVEKVKLLEASPYVYTYCVIYPQQADGLRVIDFNHEQMACGATETAVSGMTYFDMYTQNNGVYYAKVIKIQ